MGMARMERNRIRGRCRTTLDEATCINSVSAASAASGKAGNCWFAALLQMAGQKTHNGLGAGRRLCDPDLIGAS